MPTDIAITPVFVLDLEESREFYLGLGFEPGEDVDFETMRWLTLNCPGRPHQLLLAAVDEHIPPPDRDPVKAQVTKGNFAIFLTVDDVDATFERLRAEGREVLQEPTDTTYGMRDCAVRDPSGNHLRLAQPLA